MKSLKVLFSESTSISMMRVMSLLCCVNAVVLSIMGILKDKPDYSGLAILCSAFLGAGFTGKVMQKKEEGKK